VLPLVNLSPDPENEYFSDGMTDELINALAKVPGLHVVSRTSAFAFKGRALDVRAIGAQLGVETVLEGSVRRAGRRLRLAAQLVNVADGYQLWSETFDREFEDVFAIQDEVSRGIVDTLRIKLLGRAAGPLVRPATDDYEAYTLYLKGRHHWNRRTEGALRQGLEFFQHALERDPDYPLAHVGVADSYAILGFYCELPPAEAFPAARAAAQRALALDPALAEAHPALAYVAMYHDWDWAAAEREFLLAIELNPGYATAHQWYGNFLAVLGRFAESEAAFSRGIALDPLSALRNASLGWGYYFAREYARAVAQCRRALELDPDLAVANLWLGISLEQAGELEEAAVALRRAYQISGNPGNLAALAHALGLAGRRSDAASLEGQLRDLAAARYVSAYDLALAHLGSGDTAEALASLERGYAERTHQMVFLKVDPRLDPLRADPGFADLMRRMRL
jgi:serine/threonine-protein kinase